MATISECRYRWLRFPDLNLPFGKFLSLGGRSEEISQVCVVWGKAVAVSRYHVSPTMNGLRERISPDQGGKLTLYLDLEAFPGAVGVNCDAMDQGVKASDECSSSAAA
jgi:hypothetical protein